MSRFVEWLLLGSWTDREFRKQTRVTHIIFKFLCDKCGPCLKKVKTRSRVIIPVQKMLAMSLHMLGSGDGLQNI